MSDLRDLYQDMIFDHNRHPRNFGPLASANHHADGVNPLCGDKLTVYLDIDSQGVIRDVHFQGSGCAISMASASLMTEAVKGKTIAEAEAMFEGFHALMTQDQANDAATGKLRVLSGVKAYPSRIKCATLAWHAMRAALHDGGKPVTTE